MTHERKRPRRGAMMLGSEEILDCITAALIHSDIFSSCDEEDHDEPIYHNKRCRYSTDSSRSSRSCRSSLSQKSVSEISLCDSVAPCEDDVCSVPRLDLPVRATSPQSWTPATSQQSRKTVVTKSVAICSGVAPSDSASKSSNEIADTRLFELGLSPNPSPEVGS